MMTICLVTLCVVFSPVVALDMQRHFLSAHMDNDEDSNKCLVGIAGADLNQRCAALEDSIREDLKQFMRLLNETGNETLSNETKKESNETKEEVQPAKHGPNETHVESNETVSNETTEEETTEEVSPRCAKLENKMQDLKEQLENCEGSPTCGPKVPKMIKKVMGVVEKKQAEHGC